MNDSSAPLPCVELLTVNGIKADLPQVALLFHLLLEQTHDTIKSFPLGGMPNFVIFAPDDSMANILDLSVVLFSDSI
jgi:hypothetical protein